MVTLIDYICEKLVIGNDIKSNKYLKKYDDLVKGFPDTIIAHIEKILSDPKERYEAAEFYADVYWMPNNKYDDPSKIFVTLSNSMDAKYRCDYITNDNKKEYQGHYDKSISPETLKKLDWLKDD